MITYILSSNQRGKTIQIYQIKNRNTCIYTRIYRQMYQDPLLHGEMDLSYLWKKSRNLAQRLECSNSSTFYHYDIFIMFTFLFLSLFLTSSHPLIPLYYLLFFSKFLPVSFTFSLLLTSFSISIPPLPPSLSLFPSLLFSLFSPSPLSPSHPRTLSPFLKICFFLNKNTDLNYTIFLGSFQSS